jgi:actin-related protein 5
MLSLYKVQVYTKYHVVISSNIVLDAFIVESADVLIISCGYQATHIIPYLNGCVEPKYCRRINLGGCQVDGFMQRLIQLKHPPHLNYITLSRAEVFWSFLYYSSLRINFEQFGFIFSNRYKIFITYYSKTSLFPKFIPI